MYGAPSPGSAPDGVADQGVELIRQGIAILQKQLRSHWSGSARAAVVVELSEVCERLEAERTRAIGDWDADHAWALDGALSAASWLEAHTPLPKVRAHQIVRTARTSRRFERVGEALACGELSSPHAEVLATATRGRSSLAQRDQGLLLQLASTLPVDDFTTAMKVWRSAADDEMASEDALRSFTERSVSHASTLYGRVDVQVRLDAEGGATVIEALESYDTGPDVPPEQGGPADGPRTVAQRHADALVQICAEAVARRQAAGHPTPGIDATIDVTRLGDAEVGAQDTAVSPTPWDPSLLCELRTIGPVARDVLRRLACDCAVGRIVMRGGSEVLDVGRRTRVPSRALRRAIERRDRGCVFPGCTAPVRWCDVHHLVHWADGGPTNLDNCLLLCRRHHLLCHEGGWRIARDVDGVVEVVERGPDPRPRWSRGPGDGRPVGSRRRSRSGRRAPPSRAAP